MVLTMWKFEINDGPSHNDYFVDWFRYISAKTKIGIKLKRLFYKTFNTKNNYIGYIFKV